MRDEDLPESSNIEDRRGEGGGFGGGGGMPGGFPMGRGGGLGAINSGGGAKYLNG